MKYAKLGLMVLGATLAFAALANEKLFGLACRSVHLAYPGPESTVFYNEVSVEQSAPGTYFCVCGFGQGYYGMQELADGKKLLIFSVWDPGKQDDPRAVADEQRVKLVYNDPKVKIGRFGGEGTGGQSFYHFEWKNQATYKFMVSARANSNRTEYTGWFFEPNQNSWLKLVTFSTLADHKLLRGYYSFIEDFRRNRESAKQPRVAWFENGWVLSTNQQWTALSRAQFTADSNPDTNINARVVGPRFQLSTGGETKNQDTRLKEFMNRTPGGLVLPAELTK